jgi:predicted MFS family arabinose efflux permease
MLEFSHQTIMITCQEEAWGNTNTDGCYHTQVGSFGRDIIGISTSDSALLILVINAVGIIGRVPPAFLANAVTGPLNLLIIFTLLTAVLLLCWIPVHDRTGLFAFDVTYGLVVAAGQGLFPPTLSSLTTDMSKMGVRNGMCLTVISFACLVGTPIAGLLVQAMGGRYLYAQIFAGGLIFLGGCLLAASRIVKTGAKIWVKV